MYNIEEIHGAELQRSCIGYAGKNDIHKDGNGTEIGRDPQEGIRSRR